MAPISKNDLILVTGGNGFIGSHLARKLHSEGYRVRIIDLVLKSKFPGEICSEFVQGDLRDPIVCNKAVAGVHFVVHMAAVMGGMGMIHEANDIEIYQSNHTMTFNILRAAVEQGVATIFLASTACVYPDSLQRDRDVSLRETDVWNGNPPRPQGLYGLEKLASESLLRSVANRLDIRVARFHNIYGPHGSWCDGREKAPAALIRKALVAKRTQGTLPSVEVWGNGHQRRSFLYIDDCIEAVIKLLRSDCQEPVNIGSDESISVKDLVEIAFKAVGLTAPSPILHFDDTKPVGVPSRNSNNELIEKTLGWAPRTPFEEGISRTAKWMEGEMDRVTMNLAGQAHTELMASFRRSAIVDLSAELVTFALLVPITSRGAAAAEDCLTNFDKLLASLVQTTWRDASSSAASFKYHIYIAIDEEDVFLRKSSYLQDLLVRRGIRRQDFTFIVCAHPRGHVCKIWRTAGRKAWNDGCDYFLLLGDDVEILDEGWMRSVHEHFQAAARENELPFGCCCVAFTDVSFPGMPTFPVVHRFHLDVFGGDIIPDCFINQDGDPYLFQLYRRFGVNRAMKHRLCNSIGGDGPARYKKERAQWTLDILESGTTRLETAHIMPKEKRQLTLDIIVPCYRVQLAYLDRIIALRPSPTCSVMFIIVVDNPQSPHIEALEKQYKWRMDVRIRVNTTNKGASASRNRGLTESAAEWVYFLDDDVIPKEDLLIEAEKAIRASPTASGFVGLANLPVADTVSTAAIQMTGITYFWDIATKVKTDIPWGVTANLIARRNVPDGVYFNEDFPKTGGGEDVDFCIQKRNYSVAHGGEGFVAAPKAIVTHPWWNSGRRSYWRFFNWARGDGHLIKLYPEHTFPRGLPNGAVLILLSGATLVLGVGLGVLFGRWRFARTSIATMAFIPVAEVLLDLYRHFIHHPERVGGMNIALQRPEWLFAAVESTCIRLASELGRMIGMVERREFGQIGLNFDWDLGRVGPGLERDVRRKSQELLALLSMFLALYMAL